MELKSFNGTGGQHSFNFDDANIDEAAVTCSNFKFRNAGQVCISPTFLFRKILKNFVKFSQKIPKVKLGDGLDKDTNVGPLANKRGLEHIIELVEDAKVKGAKVLTGGFKVKFNKFLLRAYSFK